MHIYIEVQYSKILELEGKLPESGKMAEYNILGNRKTSNIDNNTRI
jgi:hypothetical protein